MNINELAPLLNLAAIVVGAGLCFAGFRVYMFVIGLSGFIAGAVMLGSLAFALSNNVGWTVLGVIGGGLIGTWIAIAAYVFGIFMLGASIGGGLATVLLIATSVTSGLPDGGPALAFVLLMSFVGGIVAIALNKLVIVLSTSFFGSLAMVLGVGYFIANWRTSILEPELTGSIVQQAFRFEDGVAQTMVGVWFLLWMAGVLVQSRGGSAATVASVQAPARRDTEAPARPPRAFASSSGSAAPTSSAPRAGSRGGSTASVIEPAAGGRMTASEAMAAVGAVVDARSAATEASARLSADRAPQRRALVSSAATEASSPGTESTAGGGDVNEASPSNGVRVAQARLVSEAEGLRCEVAQLVAASGPALAAWSEPVWTGWDERSAREGGAGGMGLRLGELRLAGPDGGLGVPAVVDPTRVGVVIVDGLADAAVVRGAFVGWCVRLLAVSGAGSVAVEWFEDGEGAAVPAAWRAPPGAALVERHRALSDGTVRHTVEGARRVLIAMGSAADRLPLQEGWPGSLARQGLAARVHLLLAPTMPAAVEAEAVVRLTPMGRGEALRWVDGDVDAHEVLLQTPPPASLVERLAAWSLPVTPAEELAAQEERAHEQAHVAESTPSDETAASRGVAAEALPPLVAFWEERLRDRLALPPQRRPSLCLGVDEQLQPIEASVDQPLLLRGATAEDAAGCMASLLVDIAAQTRADEWELVVLDYSDEPAVADRFDAILDAPPHLVEFVDGIAARLRLQDVVERSTDASGERPHVFAFVLAHARQPLPDGLDEVLRGGPDAGVSVCLWTPADHGGAQSAVSGQFVVTLGEQPSLRIVGQPQRPLRLPAPITSSEVAAVTAELQRTRG